MRHLIRPAWIAALTMWPLAAMAGQCQIQQFPAIPVTMKSLRPMVSAKINGAEARFIVDTGAFWSMISPAADAQYNLPEEMTSSGFFIEGVNGDTGAQIATVRTFTFLHLPLRNMQFLVAGNDYPSGAVGLLGDNLWRAFDVEYDFARGLMRMVKASHCGDLPLAYWARNEPIGIVRLRDTSRWRPHLIGHATVNGKRIRVMFDTGFPRSMLTLAAAKRLGIGPGSPGVVSAGKFGGIARQWRNAWIAPIAVFEIGGEKIEHTHLLIGDTHGLDRVAMYVGTDFFLSHHVYVSNSRHKLYFTYNGGPVFALGQRYLIKRGAATPVLAGTGAASADSHSGGSVPSAGHSAAPAPSAPAAGTGEPAQAGSGDADALARQGMAYASERQYASALADLNQACELDPANAAYRLHRGRVHEALKQPALALADFNAAISLKPDLFQARLARAELLLSWTRAPAGAAAQARTDINIVALEAPDESELHLPLARLYGRIGQYADGIRQIDQWIYYHANDELLPVALNTRCWIRAEAGVQLREALKDCDRALRWMPKSAGILDSRGLVYLRLGHLGRSIESYDAALAINPKIADSLYGRGLAELRQGKKAVGDADLSAAAQIYPAVAKRFARMKLDP